jgi:hypothetical protein
MRRHTAACNTVCMTRPAGSYFNENYLAWRLSRVRCAKQLEPTAMCTLTRDVNFRVYPVTFPLLEHSSWPGNFVDQQRLCVCVCVCHTYVLVVKNDQRTNRAMTQARVAHMAFPNSITMATALMVTHKAKNPLA